MVASRHAVPSRVPVSSFRLLFLLPQWCKSLSASESSVASPCFLVPYR